MRGISHGQLAAKIFSQIRYGELDLSPGYLIDDAGRHQSDPILLNVSGGNPHPASDIRYRTHSLILCHGAQIFAIFVGKRLQDSFLYALNEIPQGLLELCAYDVA
jgi:hypothetical protein